MDRLLNTSKLKQEIKSNLHFQSNSCVAYLQNVFLSSGYFYDGNGYHLEFAVSNLVESDKIIKLLSEYGIASKTTVRHNKHIVYMKDSQSISDTFVLLGAKNSVLEFNNILAMADLKKSINRATNCINANIDKALDTSFKQVQKIKYLIDSGQMQNFNSQCRQAAFARLQYPEYSLQQLAQVLGISKSGIKHRLDKLVKNEYE
ncbi:MAG: DNA-binding protein WhiA [Clostridiales bacterium]|nr:DNA-binding protein WhiA [Clostridiales bacterium]